MDSVNANMLSLFAYLIQDSLNEPLYFTTLAGLNYTVNTSYYGLDVSFNGYNDKMGVLINKVFEKMTSLKIDPKRFNILKENVTLFLFQKNIN